MAYGSNNYIALAHNTHATPHSGIAMFQLYPRGVRQTRGQSARRKPAVGTTATQLKCGMQATGNCVC